MNQNAASTGEGRVTHPDPNVRELTEAVAQLCEQLTGKPRAYGPEAWLSVRELAQLTGEHPATVRRWITDHGLPGKKLPGTGGYLVRYADFLTWRNGDDTVQVLTKTIANLDRRAS